MLKMERSFRNDFSMQTMLEAVIKIDVNVDKA